MKITSKAVTAVAVIALGCGALATQPSAGELGQTASVLKDACTVAAGRFETSWAYNDNSVRWGEIASCVTPDISLSCQDDACAAEARNRATILSGREDNTSHVRPDRVAFDRALSSTAMY